jgi:hypothetical protein
MRGRGLIPDRLIARRRLNPADGNADEENDGVSSVPGRSTERHGAAQQPRYNRMPPKLADINGDGCNKIPPQSFCIASTPTGAIPRSAIIFEGLWRLVCKIQGVPMREPGRMPSATYTRRSPVLVLTAWSGRPSRASSRRIAAARTLHVTVVLI